MQNFADLGSQWGPFGGSLGPLWGDFWGLFSGSDFSSLFDHFSARFWVGSASVAGSLGAQNLKNLQNI